MQKFRILFSLKEEIKMDEKSFKDIFEMISENIKVVIYGSINDGEAQMNEIRKILIDHFSSKMAIKVNKPLITDMKKHKEIHIAEYIKLISECDICIIVPKSDGTIGESTLHMMEIAHFLNKDVIIFGKDADDHSAILEKINEFIKKRLNKIYGSRCMAV